MGCGPRFLVQSVILLRNEANVSRKKRKSMMSRRKKSVIQCHGGRGAGVRLSFLSSDELYNCCSNLFMNFQNT